MQPSKYHRRDQTGTSSSATGACDVAACATPLVVGVNQGDLNRFAEAGGTEQAYFVADGANAGLDLLATLNAIRGRL
jgi:hypothetical protein